MHVHVSDVLYVLYCTEVYCTKVCPRISKEGRGGGAKIFELAKSINTGFFILKMWVF